MVAVAAQPAAIYNAYQPYPAQSVMEDSDSDRPPSPASSSSSIQGDFAMDTDHAHFYHQQQHQAMLYQQHQQQNGLEPGAGKLALKEAQRHARMNPDGDDDDEYGDEESDSDSMPDDSIDFSLTYALHTFLATVEGQASVVKGDSLVLLDDANSYWWLVRVLKTEDVGYIPAENIETPYERLARLNKHRNVDLAAATQTEKQAGAVQSRERLKGAIAGKGRSARMDKSGDAGGSEESAGSRRVVFAPPTYVDHPGVTWSSDEESEGEEGMEIDGLEEDGEQEQGREVGGVDQGLDDDMEPDDGVEWADDAAQGEQRRVADQRYQQQQPQALAEAQAQAPSATQPKSNNPFARKSNLPVETISTGHGPGGSTTSLTSAGGSPVLDPAAAGNDTRRITATPAVAGGPLMASANITNGPSKPGGGSQPGSRNVSGQSTTSVYSTVSAASSASTGRSSTPNSGSPENAGGKMKKSRKLGEAGIGSGSVSSGSAGLGAGSVSSAEGGEKKKRGILGGLFSRKGKEKGKGMGGGDGRSSEDSTSMEDGRFSEDGPVGSSPSANGRGTPVGRRASAAPQSQAQAQAQEQGQGQQNDVSVHSMKLQQQDQARMQSYTSKYLSKSPSSELHSPNAAEAAAAVARSAAAMRLAASMGMGGGVVGANGMIGEGAAPGAGASAPGEGRARPSSIIMSPNPAGPPLLNVIRIFAGTDVQSESSFKTALINETTSAADLIRQATQRFHLPHVPGTGGTSSSAALVEAGYYVTVRDVNGEEMELAPDERPLAAFQAAVARWSDADDPDATDEHGQLLNARLGAITPTVKRSSVSSISSMVSLSSHPAIAKLGMNDYSDDSQVKIYLNRRGGRGGAGAGVWAGVHGVQGAGAGAGQGRGMPEAQSEFSSYSTGMSGLSTVQESSPDQSVDHSHANGHADSSGDVESPSTPTQFSHSQAAAAAQAQRQDPSSQAPAPAPGQAQRYNPSLTISTPGQSQAPPERYMSPSARFTLQLLIHASDLPDGVVFDPHSEGIVARGALRERQLNGPASQSGQGAAVDEGPRKRLFTLPRNANVVDAIEQGLERFGVQEGVVDGGDEVEDKVGKRRSMTRVRYRLAVVVGGQEKQLFPSSKVLDAYPAAPNFKPIEKSTPEQRRRSRDLSYHAGSTADILLSDPVFILRRVVPRGLSGARIDGQPQAQTQSQTQRQPAPAPITVISPPPSGSQSTSPDPRSPQEIIAAQRAASRANQLSLISSANTDKGVDVVLPQHQGTVRSVKQTGADGGQVVRYSYIDEGGETYDISDLLEEEWGADGAAAGAGGAGVGAAGKDEFGTSLVTRPGAGLVRTGTGSSEYVTAPSTPDETFAGLPSFSSPSQTGRASTEPVEILHDAQNAQQPGDEQPRPSSCQRIEQDLLHRAVQRASQDGEAGLSEALSRVINRVKEGGKGSTSSEEVVRGQQSERERGRVGSPDSEAGTGTRTPSGRTTPQQSQYQRTGSADPHATPRASNAHQYDQSRSHSRSNSRSGTQTPSQSPATSSHSRSSSRQNQHELQNTAASVNRIISRHRQQPSIASIMSDLETPAQASPESRSRERSAPLDEAEGDDETEGDDADDGGFGDRSSTPATATSSTHPTPPFNGTASFTRALNVRSPTPGTPVSYRDDFGMKDMMAVIRMRAREFRPAHAVRKTGASPESGSNSGSSDRSRSSNSGDSVHTADTSPSEHAGAEGACVDVDRHLVGEKIEWGQVHPDVRACFEGAQERLDRFDKEVDELLVAVGAMGA